MISREYKIPANKASKSWQIYIDKKCEGMYGILRIVRRLISRLHIFPVKDPIPHVILARDGKSINKQNAQFDQ